MEERGSKRKGDGETAGYTERNKSERERQTNRQIDRQTDRRKGERRGVASRQIDRDGMA